MKDKNLAGILVALSVFLLSVVPSDVLAGQGSQFHYFSILAETMRPVDSTIGYDCDNGYLTTTSNSTAHPGSAQYIAQVNLPHGAVIINATCHGYDTDSDGFSFSLYRYRVNDVFQGQDAFEQITQDANSDDQAQGVVVLNSPLVDPLFPPGLSTINNEDYSYGLYLNMPAPASDELWVVRCVVRAAKEDSTHFNKVEINGPVLAP